MLRFFCIGSALLLVSVAFAQESASPTEKPTPVPTPPEPKITVSSVPVDGPYIALTFDDGPSEKLTPRLLDLLAQHHIHATFFVIGENVAQHPEIVKRAASEGHEIGNHSFTHTDLGTVDAHQPARASLVLTSSAPTTIEIDPPPWLARIDALRIPRIRLEAPDQVGPRLAKAQTLAHSASRPVALLLTRDLMWEE